MEKLKTTKPFFIFGRPAQCWAFSLTGSFHYYAHYLEYKLLRIPGWPSCILSPQILLNANLNWSTLNRFPPNSWSQKRGRSNLLIALKLNLTFFFTNEQLTSILINSHDKFIKNQEPMAHILTPNNFPGKSVGGLPVNWTPPASQSPLSPIPCPSPQSLSFVLFFSFLLFASLFLLKPTFSTINWCHVNCLSQSIIFFASPSLHTDTDYIWITAHCYLYYSCYYRYLVDFLAARFMGNYLYTLLVIDKINKKTWKEKTTRPNIIC